MEDDWTEARASIPSASWRRVSPLHLRTVLLAALLIGAATRAAPAQGHVTGSRADGTPDHEMAVPGVPAAQPRSTEERAVVLDDEMQGSLLRRPSKTVLIAGDIASCDWSADARTAALIASRRGVVMTTGDNAYPVADRSVLRNCYGPTWGRFKSRTRPALGNHDDLEAFSAYFGRKGGPRGRGYYAFDLGSWRIYVLDSNCGLRPRCTMNSPQYRWLRRDLERHPRRCTMAVLHHPVHSSGIHGNSSKTIPLVRLLYGAGTEVVVNGHDHLYERFQRARPWGGVDLDHGLRQFIVGTGGAPLYPFKEGRPPHSQVRRNDTHGVLRLRLSEDQYAWKFLPVRGRTFSDQGASLCHDPRPPRSQASISPSILGIPRRR
jgi:acid phosphatase type 7